MPLRRVTEAVTGCISTRPSSVITNSTRSPGLRWSCSRKGLGGVSRLLLVRVASMISYLHMISLQKGKGRGPTHQLMAWRRVRFQLNR